MAQLENKVDPTLKAICRPVRNLDEYTISSGFFTRIELPCLRSLSLCVSQMSRFREGLPFWNSGLRGNRSGLSLISGWAHAQSADAGFRAVRKRIGTPGGNVRRRL